MQMSDSREIAAPRSAVWSALLSAETLKDCVPGCREMTGSAADGFEAVVVQKVGPVKATFKGRVTLSDMVEGESLTLAGEGKGGAAGFAKGVAQVRLEAADPGATVLHYEVDARVGGKLAQLGSRIIDGFAKRMADQFFTSFQHSVEGPGPEPESGPEPEFRPESEPEPEPQAPKKGWLGRVLRG